MELKALFAVVSDKLEKRCSKKGTGENFKVELDLKQVNETKGTSEAMMIHQECHPKDASRRALQRARRERHVPVIRDLLGGQSNGSSL